MALSLNKANANATNWILKRLAKDLDLRKDIQEKVIKKLKEKLGLKNDTSLKYCDYYFIFKRNEDGRKIISDLKIKTRSFPTFVSIGKKEMMSTGAHPNEYKEYLEKIKAGKVKIDIKTLENL